MAKPVALANSLHHGPVRLWRGARCEEVSLALFGQALGTVTATSETEDEGKVLFTELVRVSHIGSVRADDKAVEDMTWRFSLEIPPRRGRSSGNAEIVSFEATTESDRVEWVRALLLAKQLGSSKTSGSKERHSDHVDVAFLRFASSDSEDCDSDSAVSDMSVEQFCQLQLTPSGSTKVIADIIAVAQVSITDSRGKGISVSLPLSKSMRLAKPLHRLKLRAMEELRIQVHDAMQESSTGAIGHGFSELQELLRHEADHFILYARAGSGIWLKDELQPLSHYIKHESKDELIILSLEQVSSMPFPKIQLSITATKNKVSDLSQKSYTAYLIDVHFNDMNWQVQRRFKEFHKLHQELREKYPDCELPKLPSKHVFTPLEGQFVNRRRMQLEQYTRSLVDHPIISLDVLFMSFLGVVSTSRDRDLSKNEKSVIHVTALHVGLDYGDIILFSCRFGASVLQRKVTGSKYDHIGIVVPGESRNLLRILEATGEGIQVYSLKARLMAYSREVSKAIVVRRFTANRTPETLAKMRTFVERVDGNPYSILGILQTRGESERTTLAESKSATSSPLGRRASQTASTGSDEGRSPTLARRLSTGMLAPSPVKENDESEPSKRKYFCSSLAAAALKHLGWLETTHKSSYFWPGSFEEGGEIEKYLAPGVSLSKETLVDCRIIEVGLATTSES